MSDLEAIEAELRGRTRQVYDSVERVWDDVEDELATRAAEAIRALRTERDAKDREITWLLEKVEQIEIVCGDNAADTCRHDLALKFVAGVAASAIAGVRA